jgi:S-adenosylmethionine uptake transporter
MKGAESTANPLDLPQQGIAFVLAGVLVFSVQDVVIKVLSGNFPMHELVAVRSALALLPLLVVVHFEGGLDLLRTRRPGLHLLRSGCQFLAYTCFYMALAALPLADAVALAFSAPLFVAALSGPLLGEPVGPRRWLAVAFGFLGVLIMLQPGVALIDPAAVLATAGALFYALSLIMTRRLGATDRGSTMAFYTTAFYLVAGTLVGLAIGRGGLLREGHASLAFLTRAWVLPQGRDLLLIGLLGAISAAGFYFLSQAYRLARAATVVAFEYVAVPLSILWGYLVWGDLPGAHTLAGMALVVGSGLYVLQRESARSAA